MLKLDSIQTPGKIGETVYLDLPMNNITDLLLGSKNNYLIKNSKESPTKIL